MASKRQSMFPREKTGPKAPVNFSSTITIADSAVLVGNHTINISSESVVQPRAKLDSSNGRITIGRRCIIYERTTVGAASSDPEPSESRFGVEMGDNCTVETGATIESGDTMIGEGCTIGAQCQVGKGAKLGKYCTLTPQTIVQPNETIPDFTVIFSNGMRRLDKRACTDTKNKLQKDKIDVLRQLIPSNPAKFQ